MPLEMAWPGAVRDLSYRFFLCTYITHESMYSGFACFQKKRTSMQEGGGKQFLIITVNRWILTFRKWGVKAAHSRKGRRSRKKPPKKIALKKSATELSVAGRPVGGLCVLRQVTSVRHPQTSIRQRITKIFLLETAFDAASDKLLTTDCSKLWLRKRHQDLLKKLIWGG